MILSTFFMKVWAGFFLRDNNNSHFEQAHKNKLHTTRSLRKNMSLQSYFESLQKEHNATCVTFVVDQARGDGRMSSLCVPSYAPSGDDENECLKQRPSFSTYSERLSSAPKCPLRSRDNERIIMLSQVEQALEVLSLSLSELSQ